jgi:hypothetical protein
MAEEKRKKRNTGSDPMKAFEIHAIKVRDTDTTPKNNGYDQFLIPNHPSRTAFVGTSGCGKTNVILNLLQGMGMYKNYFEFIHLFSPTYFIDKSWRAMDNLLPDKRPEKCVDSVFMVHEEYSLPELIDIINEQKELVKEQGYENTKTLYIFDDVAANAKLMNSSKFAELFMTGRHSNSSTWISTQHFKKMASAVRGQISNWILFDNSSEEMKKMAKEIPPGCCNEKRFIEVMKFATKERYGFLHVNKQAPDSRNWFRQGFSDIIDFDAPVAILPEDEASALHNDL